MKNKILVIRFSSLGDIVLSSSFVKFLYQNFHENEIYFLTKKIYKDVFDFFPISLNVIYLEDFFSIIKLANFINKQKFDYIFDIHNNLRTHLLKLLVKQKIYSYRKKHFYRIYKILKHKKNIDFYVYKQYFSTLPNYKKINYPKLELKRDVPITFNKDRIKIGIHPGASNLTKIWNIENLIGLINLLIKEHYEVSIIYSTIEKFIIENLRRYFDKSINYVFTGNSLKELFIEIQKQHLMITMDSGASHISYSFGIPTITLFGSTHPSLGFVSDIKENIVLTVNEQCSPCTLHGSEACPKEHFNCMKKISYKIVFNKIKDVLEEYYGIC